MKHHQIITVHNTALQTTHYHTYTWCSLDIDPFVLSPLLDKLWLFYLSDWPSVVYRVQFLVHNSYYSQNRIWNFEIKSLIKNEQLYFTNVPTWTNLIMNPNISISQQIQNANEHFNMRVNERKINKNKNIIALNTITCKWITFFKFFEMKQKWLYMHVVTKPLVSKKHKEKHVMHVR